MLGAPAYHSPMPAPSRRRGSHAAVGRVLLPLAAAATFAEPLGAQVAPPPPAARWSLSGEYRHLGAAPIRRRALPSMAVSLGRTLGAADPARAPRLEAGWLRASRVATQAQGVTLGMSVGVPIAPHAALVLRPGVAALAGWAEAQGGDVSYDWRGLDGTEYAGQNGTATSRQPVRGRTTGLAASLAADLRLTRALALTGSVQQWGFTGPVIRPNRRATLAGVGLTIHPAGLARDARDWGRAHDAAPARPPRPTVPAERDGGAGVVPPAAATPTRGGAR